MEKILVIIDVQNDFVDGSLGSEAAQKIVPNILNKIDTYETYLKEGSISSIYCTRDTHFEDYLETREGKMLPVKHCIKNTNGWEINSLILRRLENKDYKVVDKNIFGSIELIEDIKKLINNTNHSEIEIELVGLVTNICVISNALVLRTFFPKIKIIVDSNCCAGTTLEAHNSALMLMKHNDIEVL